MQFIVNIHRIFTYLLAAIPIIPQQWVTYLIAIWGVLSLFLLDFKKTDDKKYFWGMLLASPFFLLLIQAWVSQNKTDWFAVEKAHSFWVFPLCILFLKKIVPSIHLLLFHRILAYSMAALAVATSIYFLLFGFKITAIEQHDFIFRYRNEINQLIHIHPTYLSLMAVYSILFLFYAYPNFSKSINHLHIVIAIILFFFTYFLAARLVWIAGAASWVMMIFLNKQLSIVWKVVTMITLLALLGGMFSVNPRTAEFVSFKKDQTASNSLKVRTVISKCAISLIPIALPLGFGPTETQKKLNECYGNDLVFKNHAYNTHNQYLDYLLSLGLPGFLFLILILIAGLIVAWKYHNLLFLSFLVLSSIIMLGENILNRQSGVVFFCLFYSIFIRQHLLQEDEKLID
ncbi:MAG: O-antigen ligase family protein [Flavobacteriales bacterium]|nr:O-antigen ligase family protein [Flavobacteriales bacterium]